VLSASIPFMDLSTRGSGVPVEEEADFEGGATAEKAEMLAIEADRNKIAAEIFMVSFGDQ
jgi:hypothetical protein